MAFTLQQLETFFLVVKSGSFSKAAKLRGCAQSGISTTIANLEIELGVELFDRSTKFPTLTIEGKVLLEATESVLNQARYMEELSNTLSLGLESQVNILIDDAIPDYILEQLLYATSKKYQQVKVNVRRPISEAGVSLLSKGAAVLALLLTNANYTADITFRRLGDLLLVNTAAATHPLAKDIVKGKSFAMLHEYRQLVYEPHGGRLPTSEYLLASNTWYFNSYSLILKFLKKSYGWATFPKHLIENELKNGTLVELNLESYPSTEWLVGLDLIWSRKQKLGIIASWMRDYIINMKQPGLLNFKTAKK